MLAKVVLSRISARPSFFSPEGHGTWTRILVQVMIYHTLLIGRDGHLDQSEAYDISFLVREYGTCIVSGSQILADCYFCIQFVIITDYIMTKVVLSCISARPSCILQRVMWLVSPHTVHAIWFLLNLHSCISRVKKPVYMVQYKPWYEILYTLLMLFTIAIMRWSLYFTWILQYNPWDTSIIQ